MKNLIKKLFNKLFNKLFKKKQIIIYEVVEKVVQEKKKVEYKRTLIKCYRCGMSGGTLWRAPSGRYVHGGCVGMFDRGLN